MSVHSRDREEGTCKVVYNSQYFTVLTLYYVVSEGGAGEVRVVLVERGPVEAQTTVYRPPSPRSQYAPSLFS